MELTKEEWVEAYEPQLHLRNKNKNYYNENREALYGFYDIYDDEDKEFLKEISGDRIWTLVNEDNHDYILSGFHIVNRLEYYICAKPFDVDMEIVVDMGCCCDEELDEECEDCE